CPCGVPCSSLPAVCLQCDYTASCVYGAATNITCRPREYVDCEGPETVQRSFSCRFCYQTSPWEHDCATSKTECRVIHAPLQRQLTNCTVQPHVHCLG
ncbi:hypothetical protein CAPTEDRAFT_38939, partial [Capitella teleta]